MRIEWIIGEHSSCLAINGTRITNGSLYGIGKTCLVFNVNGEPTQGKVSKEDFQYHLEKIEERRKRFLKDTKHRHHWDLCWRERWKVEPEKINEALNLI